MYTFNQASALYIGANQNLALSDGDGMILKHVMYALSNQRAR